MLKRIFFVFCLLFSIIVHSQITISGEVYDEFLEPFSGAIIKDLESGATTVSDINGKFSIKVKLPSKIIVSYIDYSSEQIEVLSSDQVISCILKENTNLDQVILSASRLPERLFESPVSIERISFNQIRKTPSVTFYESLENLKNVDVKTNSVLLKSVNTRGFSTIENNRFVQLIDGADNLFPIGNLPLGNLTGLVDADVKDVEVLTGASSALYGANAFNGVLLINSKNPFDYQGITANFQGGITTQDSGINAFYNPSVRAAYKFNDYFAAKVAFGIYSGEEWHADDFRTKQILSNSIDEKSPNDRTNQYNYDGVNIYGDELPFNIKAFPFILFLARRAQGDPAAITSLGLIGQVPNIEISRNGYKDNDLIDNETSNNKLNLAFHLRPFGNDKLEISWASRFNIIKSVMQVSKSRLQLDGLRFNQHILNIKGNSFNLLGYINATSGGDSYAVNALGNRLNNLSESKNSLSWFSDFFNNYVELSPSGIVTLKDIDQAIVKADQLYNVLTPNTTGFNNTVATLKARPLYLGGAKIEDTSKVYHAEGNFNFDKYIDFVSFLIGGSIRRTKLNTNGNLFTDSTDPIFVDEYGAFAQLRKKFIDDRLKTTFSLRYDKSTNYKATYSPRLTLGYSIGVQKNHNIRFAAQSAFRQPKNPDRFVGSQTGVNNFSIGNQQDNLDRYVFQLLDIVKGEAIPKDGNYAFEKGGFTGSSFSKFYKTMISSIDNTSGINEISQVANRSFNLLEPTRLKKGLNPENVNSFELGYRGMINLSPTNVLEIDINGYYSFYKDFLYDKEIYIPNDDESDVFAPQDNPNLFVDDPFAIAIFNVIAQNFAKFSVPQNSTSHIESFGVGVSLGTTIFGKYDIGANYTWNDFSISDKEVGFESRFNTPNHIVKLMFGSENLFRNVGFNIAGRWYDTHLYESEFANGIIPSRRILDAQISYKLPIMKSTFKIGGNNILGTSYYDNLGSGKVGSTYYFSWVIND